MCDCQYTATVDGDESNNPHQNSVLHQFSSHQQDGHSTKSHFYLNWKNKGYQLLRSGGWDGNSGLGPERSGKKFPVKTVLKRDRHGLGSNLGDHKARITHFSAKDETAVVRPVLKKVSKVQDANEQERKRNLEIDFRRMFY